MRRIVALLFVALQMSACALVAGRPIDPQDALVIGGGPLAEIPAADLTVTMEPGIEGGGLQNPPMGEPVPDSVEIVATFQTTGGRGHLARFQAVIDGQLNECIEAALPNSGSAQCGPDLARFTVSLNTFQQDRGPLINSIAIFGPPDVTAYEVDLGGFVVAIKPFNGAGYANWVGRGEPATVEAHFGSGNTESIPVSGP